MLSMPMYIVALLVPISGKSRHISNFITSIKDFSTISTGTSLPLMPGSVMADAGTNNMY
jgi:hypothetical protein